MLAVVVDRVGWRLARCAFRPVGRSFRHRQGTYYDPRATAGIEALMDVVANERRRSMSPAAELAVGRSQRHRRHEPTTQELAAAA